MLIVLNFKQVITHNLFNLDQGVMSGIITAEQFAKVFPAVSVDYQRENGLEENAAQEYASLIQATYTSIASINLIFIKLVNIKWL